MGRTAGQLAEAQQSPSLQEPLQQTEPALQFAEVVQVWQLLFTHVPEPLQSAVVQHEPTVQVPLQQTLPDEHWLLSVHARQAPFSQRPEAQSASPQHCERPQTPPQQLQPAGHSLERRHV